MIVMILSNRFWERIEERKGFKFVLSATGILLACELLLMSFLNSATYPILYISNIISGIGMGGFGVSIFTYRYMIMPEAGKTVYEGSFYFASGLSMFIAPFLGKYLMTAMPEFTSAIYANSRIQLLYLSAFAAISLLIVFVYILPAVRAKSREIREAGQH
jgi:MFS family permease